MTVFLAFLAASVVSVSPLTAADELVEAAMKACYTNRSPKLELVAELFEIERKAGLPDDVRGLLAAAACRESGYRAGVAGDGGRSVGMFQFMAWAKGAIRAQGAKTEDPRLDWRASARYWVRHVMRQWPKVRRYCKGKGGYATRKRYLWASANATAVRFPPCVERDVRGRCLKRRPRCARKGKRSETLHMAQLRRFEAHAQRKRQAMAHAQ